MSRDRIVSQSLNDPVGSIYDIDGQCYIKTSHGDSTPNHLILNEDGERCTDISQIDKCETGSGQRKATAVSGGCYKCYGDISGIGSLSYTTPYATGSGTGNVPTNVRNPITADRMYKQAWAAARDLPVEERAAFYENWQSSNDPCRYINCQPPQAYRNQWGKRIINWGPGPDPNYVFNSVHYCKVSRVGWVKIYPKSTINGVDKIKFWAEMTAPFHRWRSVTWRVLLREKETQKWHHTNVGYISGRIMDEENARRGQTIGYNPYGMSLYGALPAYDYRETPPKFHDMAIDGAMIRLDYNSQANTSMHIMTLILEKNGLEIPYLDSSISLRSTPSSEHWF